MRLLLQLLVAALLAATGPALAQAPGLPDPVTLTFQGDTAEITDRIEGKEIKRYVFAGNAGDQISVSFDAATPSANYNVMLMGSSAALYVGSTEYEDYSGALPETGDYEVRTYLMGQASETGGATYTLTIARGSSTAAPNAAGADYADGMLGGPDYWAVSNLSGNGSLNIRSMPSTDAEILTTLSTGTVVRNLGCEAHDEMTWCQVSSLEAGKFEGWASSQYLAEAQPPDTSGTDAKVAGTNYNATGSLPCVIEADASANLCSFGVTRGRPGLATVFITLPNGFERVIAFSDGEVSPMSSVSSFSYDHVGDETMIDVDNGAERYSISDAIIYGG